MSLKLLILSKIKISLNLLEIALSNFKEVKSIVLNCVNDNEPIRKDASNSWKEVIACRIACGKDKECLVKCVEAASKDVKKVDVQDRVVLAHKK